MKTTRRGRSFIVNLILFLVIITLAVSGCSTEKKEASKASRVVKKVAKGKESPEKQETAEESERMEESFTGYTATSLRDPFLPFLRENVVAVSRRAALTPLEKYDLGELKLVGILIKGNQAVALVEDTEGKGFSAKKGTRIGKNGGVVAKITAEEVIIIEEFFDISGRKVRKEKLLTLPQPEGD